MKLVVKGNILKDAPFIKEIVDLVMDATHIITNASLWSLNMRILEQGDDRFFSLGEYDFRCGGPEWTSPTKTSNIGGKLSIDFCIYTPKTAGDFVVVGTTSYTMELEAYVSNSTGHTDANTANSLLRKIESNLTEFGTTHTARTKNDETYDTFPTELVVFNSYFNNVV